MSSFNTQHRRLHLPGHAPESVSGPHEGVLLKTPDPTLSQVEKVVVGLSPLFAIVVGWLSELVARYFPGVTLPKSQLIWAFVVGVSAVVLVVLKWLHSRDARIGAEMGRASAAVLGEVSTVTGGAVTEADVRKLLDAHRQEMESLVTDVEMKVAEKLPPAAQQALANLLTNANLGDLLSGKVSAPPAAAPAAAPEPPNGSPAVNAGPAVTATGAAS